MREGLYLRSRGYAADPLRWINRVTILSYALVPDAVCPPVSVATSENIDSGMPCARVYVCVFTPVPIGLSIDVNSARLMYVQPKRQHRVEVDVARILFVHLVAVRVFAYMIYEYD